MKLGSKIKIICLEMSFVRKKVNFSIELTFNVVNFFRQIEFIRDFWEFLHFNQTYFGKNDKNRYIVHSTDHVNQRLFSNPG